MKIKYYSKTGEEKKSEKIAGNLRFECSDIAINEYIKYLNNQKRNLIAKVLDRSEVRGGGRKPWKQKGTGNARVGSNRSPIWRGGGITFGPTGNNNYKTNLNKKEIKNIKIAIIKRFAEANKLIIINKLSEISISTKNAEKLLQKIGLDGKITLVLKNRQNNAYKSFINLSYIDLLTVNKLDFSKIVSSDCLIFEEEAYRELVK